MFTRVARVGVSRLSGGIGGNNGVVTIQVATITSAHGQPREGIIPPWPYRTKPYRMWHQFLTFESTSKRMTENAKIICVDGNIGTGKTEFAKKLAKEFDFWYVPEVTDDEVYKIRNGEFDLRQLNHMLSEPARMYDMADFYAGRDLESGRAAGLQVRLYYAKFMKYAEALVHLLNTGQGVVMDRSVWSDMVFAEAMAKHGYIKRGALKYYHYLRENSICDLFTPHLTIYLDAPISTLRERINKRGKPMEVNSKVLSDDYLKTIDTVYKKRFLPEMRKFGEVMELNNNAELDWDVVVEDIERLHLEPDLMEDEHKFKNWRWEKEDDWSFYRRYFNNRHCMEVLFQRGYWHDRAPEVFPTGDAAYEIQHMLGHHPATQYGQGYSRDFGDKNITWSLGSKK